MIDACIFARLTADTAVSALIAQRMYPLLLPEDSTKPAITYRIISTLQDYDLDGATGMAQVRLELNCWGDYATARRLARAVTASLDEFAGPLSSTEGTCEVLLITRDDEQSGYDSVERSHYVQQDWMIQFTE